MGAGDTLRDLPEEWLLDTLELCGFYDIQDLLNFSQEHHFLLTARFRPELEKSLHNLGNDIFV